MNRKCAILNKVNFTNDEKELNDLEKLLVLYCIEKLEIKDYDIFTDKEKFENVVLTDEYTDILLYDKNQFKVNVQGLDLHYLNESNEQFNDFLYDELYQIIKKYTNSENIKYDKDAKQILKKYREQFNEKQNDKEEDCICSIHKSLTKKFKWSEIENIKELKDNFENNDELKILEIEDVIANTMFDLLNEEQGERFTDEVLIKIYNDPKTSEKLKEFIILYFKSNVICKEIRKII